MGARKPQQQPDICIAHNNSSIEDLSNLPRQIVSASVWRGEDIRGSYTFDLSDTHLREIYEACKAFGDSLEPIELLSKPQFPLPQLGKILERERIHLHSGRGLVVFRGLNCSRYSRKENVIIFVGLSAHLTERVGLQTSTRYLVHLKDVARNDPNNIHSSPYRSDALPFHTDYGDVVGMLVLNSCPNGGAGTFASVSTVYNTLAATSPDLVRVLMKPDWPFYNRPPHNRKYHERPVMFMNSGEPEMVFSRGSLMETPRSKRPLGVTPLSDSQLKALDAVNVAAQENALKIDYQNGDLVFFNNRKILHGRNEFHDGPTPTRSRHILRLWLQDRALAGEPPAFLSTYWARIFERGTGCGGVEQWPLEPDILSARL